MTPHRYKVLIGVALAAIVVAIAAYVALTTDDKAGAQSPPPDSVARCESGGDPSAVSGQYRGKWQFSQSTWESVGGSGDPAAASEAEQDHRAAILWDGGEGAGHWPVCAAGKGGSSDELGPTPAQSGSRQTSAKPARPAVPVQSQSIGLTG